MTASKPVFPCPVCRTPLDVRESKKGKPYVVCDYCGVQLFVRNPAGGRAFKRLVEQGDKNGLMESIAAMERRYRKHCPECGTVFWVDSSLIKTSIFNGSFLGYCCPEEGCKGVVKEESEE